MTRATHYLFVVLVCACSLDRTINVDSALVGDAGIRTEDTGTELTPDAGTESDAWMPLPDPDAGTSEPPDAGADAGPPAPTCPGASVWDDLTGYCYVRRLGDNPCTGSYEPVRWEATDEQIRLQTFLAAELDGNGAVGLRRLSSGWVWVDDLSTPPGLRWAVSPSAGEVYAYLSADGLRTYFRPYGYAYCRTVPA